MTISTVQITSNKWEDSLIESLENIEHSAMYLESILQETGGKEIYTFINFIQKLGLTVKISIDKT